MLEKHSTEADVLSDTISRKNYVHKSTQTNRRFDGWTGGETGGRMGKKEWRDGWTEGKT